MLATEVSILTRVAENIEWDADRITLRPASDAGCGLSLTRANATAPATQAQLAAFLYAHYYAFDSSLYIAAGDHTSGVVERRVADPRFLERLRAANPGTGYLADGWTVTDADEAGHVHVEKNGITLCVDPERHLETKVHRSGERLAVRFPPDSAHAMPGFYLCFGNAGPAGVLSCTRFYLNLVPDRATQIIEATLRRLLTAGIGYTLKVTNNPAYFARRDNTVLYVARIDYAIAARAIGETRHKHADGFRLEVPSLTLFLAPGIGVADSPSRSDSARDGGADLSFGQHRMTALAEGVGEALAGGVTTLEGVIEFMHASLRRAGVDPDRPYLDGPDAAEYDRHQIECGGPP